MPSSSSTKYVLPDVAAGTVVRINGVCYELKLPVDSSASVIDVDAAFETLAQCCGDEVAIPQPTQEGQVLLANSPGTWVAAYPRFHP
jgi:hypothetical protein